MKFTDIDMTEIAKASAYELARMAGTASPDSPTSPGAELLDTVRTGTLERIAYVMADDWAPERITDGDDGREIADESIPVMDYEMWRTFVDLAVWGEDIDDLAGDERNLTNLARIALGEATYRLMDAIVRDAQEKYDAATSAGDDDE